MAKKPNYSFEKRQRELDKQKKKELKKANRQKANKGPGQADDQSQRPPPEGPPDRH